MSFGHSHVNTLTANEVTKCYIQNHLSVYNNNNNYYYYYLLQLGCYPVAVVILHVYKT